MVDIRTIGIMAPLLVIELRIKRKSKIVYRKSSALLSLERREPTRKMIINVLENTAIPNPGMLNRWNYILEVIEKKRRGQKIEE